MGLPDGHSGSDRRGIEAARGPNNTKGAVRKRIVAYVLMGLYFFASFMATVFLDTTLYPPGTTGRGLWAVVVIFIGAFHIAGWLKASWAFLIFGGIGSLPALGCWPAPDPYVWLSPLDIFRILTECMAFGVATALVTRWMAMLRWWLEKPSSRER